jgi:dUTP pyrophosphatase
MSVLIDSDIRRLLRHDPPLVVGYIDLGTQVQANGFELTLRDVSVMQSAGRIDFDNSRRVISDISPLMYDGLGAIELIPGTYLITYNEIIHLPRNIMALGRPRSSLLRCGVNIGTAVWDAGYEGRSQSLLVVYNSRGIRLEKNARIMQLVFLELTGSSEGYNGIYQGENI